MSEKRTFFVRVNLDDMVDTIIGLDSTIERGLWLEGFVVGSRGKDAREDWPKTKLEGYAFGLRCFNEAEEFRGKQSEKGLASAEARRNRTSTTVQPDVNHGSTTVQPDVNQTSTYPTTNNQQPTTRSQKPRFVPPTIEEAAEYAKEIGFAGVAQWFAYYETNGWKVGKNKMTDWKAAIRYWKSKDGAAFAAPTLQEWMEHGEKVATANPTYTRQMWPRALAQAAYHGAAANGWRGVTDWKGKILSECLRWVGNENGRARA